MATKLQPLPVVGMVEPVSLVDMKSWLKISYDDDDVLISSLITAARQYCEIATKQSFVSSSWLLSADNVYDLINERRMEAFVPWLFWGAIWLPNPPLISIQSITYMLADGTMGTWDPSLYVVETGIPGRIAPYWGQMYPIIQRYQISCFQIRYTTGYDNINYTLPETAITAIKMLVTHWYEDRSPISVGGGVSSIPMAVDMLLASMDYGFTA